MTRKTIVLPDELARRVERLAKKEKRSFSRTVVELVDDALRRRGAPLRFIGAGESGLPDLGLNAEKYLRELAREWRD